MASEEMGWSLERIFTGAAIMLDGRRISFAIRDEPNPNHGSVSRLSVSV